MPLVSIGLPVLNGERYLLETLESLLAQTFDDFEVVVSDNASTDGTAAICRRLAQRDHRVRYYRNETTVGAAANFNRVFNLSSGRYFKWAAADDVCLPEFLEHCVSALERDPGVVLAYPKAMIIDERSQPLGPYPVKLETDSPNPVTRFRQLLHGHKCHEIFGVIRRDVLEKTPLMGAYNHGDGVLLSRLALRGRFEEIPEFLLLSRRHAEQSAQLCVDRRQYAIWFNPTLRNKIQFPLWRTAFEFLRSIWMAPLRLEQRLRCHVGWARQTYATRRHLRQDVVAGLRGWSLSKTSRRADPRRHPGATSRIAIDRTGTGSSELPASVRWSPEFQLLICCARTTVEPSTGERIQQLIRNGIDWPEMIKIARWHRLLPLVYWHLDAICSQSVPVAVMRELRDHFRDNTRRNLFLTGEMLQLLGVLERHGYPAVPFKGPVIAARIYGNLGLRTIGDLDILVRQEHAAEAKKLLMSLGFHPEPGCQMSWESHLVRQDGLVMVDLHWAITTSDLDEAHDCSFELDLDSVWQRLERVPLAGASVRQFSAEDLLLIHCQDTIKEYWMDKWPQLKKICDIAEIVRAHHGLDWGRLVAQAEEAGSVRMLLLFLWLAEEVLGAPIPAWVSERVRAEPSVRRIGVDICEQMVDKVHGPNRFLDPRRGFLDANLFCARLKERRRDRIPYYLRAARDFRKQTLLALTSKANHPFPLLPVSPSTGYYLVAPLYFVVRPFWRLGKSLLGRATPS